MVIPSSIVLKLDVEISRTNEEILLHHPSLKGSLSLSFSSLNLAGVQLQSIRMDKTKSALESVVDDTTALQALFGQLKVAIEDLKKI